MSNVGAFPTAVNHNMSGNHHFRKPYDDPHPYEVPHSGENVYCESQRWWVTAIYVLCIVVWFLVVWWFKLYAQSGAAFLWIPVVVFWISYNNIGEVTREVENCMSKANYLSIGLVLSLHLLVWISGDLKSNREHFVQVVMLGMFFTMLTFVDIWVSPKYLPVFKHFQSCLQTMAIALLIYAYSTYFFDGGGRLSELQRRKK